MEDKLIVVEAWDATVPEQSALLRLLLEIVEGSDPTMRAELFEKSRQTDRRIQASLNRFVIYSERINSGSPGDVE